MNIARCHEYIFNSWFESETLNIMEAWKQRSHVFVLKKKHAPAFNLTQLARFPYKSKREPIKLQSLYKLINHHAVIKRLFHRQTGNLRQFKKKQIMKRLKIIIFKMNINFEDRQSVYTFTTKKYSAREMRVCLLGILSPQCICF